MMLLARRFLPYARFQGRKEGIAGEGMGNFGNYQAVGQPHGVDKDLGPANDEGWRVARADAILRQ